MNGHTSNIFKTYNKCATGKSCGLAVEHLAHDQKVVGSIPVQC